MVKKSTIKRYENLVRDLSAEQIHSVLEAENAEEVKTLLGKPEIKNETAISYRNLIRNYYRATIAENPTRYETLLANVNPVLTAEIRTQQAEIQRLRELTEQQQRIIEEMQRQMQALTEELQRLRQAQTEDESNQRTIEEANELERAWLEQQGYESPYDSQEPETEEPELDLEFEAPEPKIERYVKKGENIIRVDQTPAMGYDLSYFKDFGNVEGSRLKVKINIRLPEENKTISVYKDLGKVNSATQAKDLVEMELDYQGGKYGGSVVGTRIYLVS